MVDIENVCYYCYAPRLTIRRVPNRLATTVSQTDRLTYTKYTQHSDKRIVVVKQRVLKNIDSPSVRYFTYTKKVAYVIIGENGRETRTWWGRLQVKTKEKIEGQSVSYEESNRMLREVQRNKIKFA